MTSSKNRKLAAILFADIVGYTAMMQSKEAHAMEVLQRFQSVITSEVAKHNGELIKSYGDGSLLIFNSTIDAMQCAFAMQTTFQDSPKVPLRIGIHAGEVIKKEGDYFGNGINIASRIESIGVAGSILFSKDVAKRIKNHPEFETVSLGSFDFKNVEESMEVFALANEGLVIPDKENITGKLKVKSSNISKFWWVIPLLLLLAFGGYYFSQQGKAALPDEIQAARIAVLPYENNTNDSTLNVLGNMAADWITRNLMNLENTKVVQFDNVKDNIDYLQANPSLFQQKTGSEKLIKGKFYAEETDLIFETQVVDANSSEVVFVFPPIRGNKNKPSTIVTELSQRVAGYFAAEATIYGGHNTAPKYEAFITMEEGNKYFGTDYSAARKHFLKAIELDSNWIRSYVFYAFTFANQGQFEKADSVVQVMDRKFKNPSKTEKIFIQNVRNQIYGNIKAAFQDMYALHQKDPKNLIPNYTAGALALGLNKPNTTLEIRKNMDPALFTFDITPKTWWFGTYAEAFIRLERYTEALDILRYVPPEAHRFEDLKAQIYVLQNQPDSLNLLIQEMENNGVAENQILARLYKIAFDFGAKGDKINQLKWGKRMLARIENRPESIELPLVRLGQAYFITEDYDHTLATYEQVKQQNGETWEYLVHVGFAYAKMGNMEMVDTFLKKYQALETPYAQGRYKYAQAMIYAGLGNKEEAMRFLRLAFKEGYGFGLWEYNYSYELASLRGYPPFEEFVKPKG